MKLDLSKPHRILESALVIIEGKEVYSIGGKFMGTLPKGSVPTTRAETMEMLSKVPIEEIKLVEKKIEKKVEKKKVKKEPEKGGISYKSLRGR